MGHKKEYEEKQRHGTVELPLGLHKMEYPEGTDAIFYLQMCIRDRYLYVNFESVQFTSATKRVDRICAFKVAAVTKKEKAKKSTKKRTKK